MGAIEIFEHDETMFAISDLDSFDGLLQAMRYAMNRDRVLTSNDYCDGARLAADVQGLPQVATPRSALWAR